MNVITVQQPKMKLMGIQCRTSNALEFQPSLAKIGLTIEKYIKENVAQRLPRRKNPGITYWVYTDYESDINGAYTYFIGEEVQDFTTEYSDFSSLIIPAQNYKKFTSNPGVMPHICINMWKTIWKMSEKELGKRNYLADFEIYDHRAADPQYTIVDIYVGIINN